MMNHSNGPYRLDVRCGNAYSIDGCEVRGGDVLTICGPSVRIGPFTNADTAEKVRKALNVAHARGRNYKEYSGAMSVDGVPLEDPVNCSIEDQTIEIKTRRWGDGEERGEPVNQFAAKRLADVERRAKKMQGALELIRYGAATSQLDKDMCVSILSTIKVALE